MATGMATRCSACGTVFRVVPDQLRVSEGWVRCGRCAEVFNATESLLDLETGAPRRLNEEPPAATPRAMVQFSSARPLETPAASPHAAEAADDDHFGRDVSPGHPAHQTRAPQVPVVDDAESRFAEDAASAGEVSAVSGADIHAEVDTDASTEASTDFNARFRAQPRSDALAMPSFVRQAERAARWRQPRVRAGLLAVGALAGLLLAAQVVFEYRDLAAARFTALRAPLQQACAALGCTLGAPRIIEGLVVESSGLVRVEKSSIYKLSLTLRNRAALEVALPALELSLTDAQGKLVARRVLSTAELGVNQTTLGAGRDLGVQATLQAATAAVTGYTIELFYP